MTTVFALPSHTIALARILRCQDAGAGRFRAGPSARTARDHLPQPEAGTRARLANSGRLQPLADGTVRFAIELTRAEQIADLLAMTPHLFRASAEGRAKAAALTALSLSVDVRLTCFERGIG